MRATWLETVSAPAKVLTLKLKWLPSMLGHCFSLGAHCLICKNLKAVQGLEVGKINQRTKISSNTASNCFPPFSWKEFWSVTQQSEWRHFIENDNFIESCKGNLIWWVSPDRQKFELHPKLSETDNALRYITHFIWPSNSELTNIFWCRIF